MVVNIVRAFCAATVLVVGTFLLVMFRRERRDTSHA
jgi:hypothetical protein